MSILMLAGWGCSDDDAEPYESDEVVDASQPLADSGVADQADAISADQAADKDGKADPATEASQAGSSSTKTASARAKQSQTSQTSNQESDPEKSQAEDGMGTAGDCPEPDMMAQTSTDMPEDQASDAAQQDTPAQPITLVGLGERLFDDTSLSLSGTQSCASCHDAANAFSGNADHEHPHFPVSRGATEGRLGTRNAPTAMYMQWSPPFAFVEDEDEPGEFTPTGGLFWDGRVNSLSEQAGAPFLNPREMALPNKQAVIERVQKTDYVGMFEPLFGPDPLGNVDMAYQHVTDAIAAFERTDRFSPFSSKFDDFLRGQAQLSEQEQRGFDLFKNPEKGNCIACHVGDPESIDPSDWLFTDFTYDNLGVPRNNEIPDNADVSYYDLGLCQSDVVLAKIPGAVADKEAFLVSLCGSFKVPTLRNVAKTAPYMHNGYFHELRDVVDFYVTRETDAARWYPKAQDGSVLKYNDLPSAYQANVNTTEVPYDRVAGEEPRLSPDEIDDVVAFLQTLSDGYGDEKHEPWHTR